MRVRPLLLVIALLAVVLVPDARAEYLAQEIGVRFPDALAGLQLRGEPQRYPQPGLGYSLHYFGPRSAVTVYIYDANQRGIGTGIAGQAVTQQFAQAERDMQAFYQQQRQPAQRLGGGPETLGAPPRQTQWLVARYAVQRGNVALTSVVMVTGYRDYFVKVRATFPAAGKGEDPLAPVAAELSALLAASLQAPATPGAPGK
jgi:hypothetical protein